MKTTTHLLFNALIFGTILNPLEETTSFTLGTLAGALPDIDSTRSLTGRLLHPIASKIEEHFSHRSITHSFIGSILIAGITTPIGLINLQWWIAIIVGYTCGWLLDAASKSGVPAFWPHPARVIIPRNPRYRITTGSTGELVLIAIMIGMFCTAVVIQKIPVIFGWREPIEDTFYQKQKVEVEIIYRDAWAQEEKKRTFTLVEVLNDSWIVEDSQYLYRIGERYPLSPLRSYLKDKQPIRIRRARRTFNDEPLEIPHTTGKTYITGELKSTDQAELPEIPPEAYNPITMTSNGQEYIYSIRNARPQDLQPLEGAYVTGWIAIKEEIVIESSKHDKQLLLRGGH